MFSVLDVLVMLLASVFLLLISALYGGFKMNLGEMVGSLKKD